MAEFRDRRKDQADFANGSGKFSLTTHGYDEEDRWSQMAPTSQARREVGDYYRGQKSTRTWQEANRLAARRTRRSGGPHETAAHYANSYQENLVRVMASKGPELAKQFGEIKPGR